nr:hypothetical protein [Tanacetum cinerariifolium]
VTNFYGLCRFTNLNSAKNFTSLRFMTEEATAVYVSIEKPDEVLDTHMDYLNNGHGDSDNGSKKSASFASIFKENTTKKTMQIS